MHRVSLLAESHFQLQIYISKKASKSSKPFVAKSKLSTQQLYPPTYHSTLQIIQNKRKPRRSSKAKPALDHRRNPIKIFTLSPVTNGRCRRARREEGEKAYINSSSRKKVGARLPIKLTKRVALFSPVHVRAGVGDR